MKPTQVLSDDECCELICYFRDSNSINNADVVGPRNALLVALMLESGLRVGECVQLRFSDLLLHDAPLKNLYVRPEIGKGGRSRLIPMSDLLKTSILNFWELIKDPDEIELTAWVFYNPSSVSHLTTRGVGQIISRAGWSCLKRNISPHMLRHTFATRLMKVSSIRVVQLLLGHKCLTSTQIYTHPDTADLKNAVDQVSLNLRDHVPNHNIK